MDEAQPVVVRRHPDIAETTRVVFPIVLRRPSIVAYLAICALIGVILGAIGAILLTELAPGGASGWFFVFIGALFIGGPWLLIRSVVRRSLAKTIASELGVITFSPTGIDSRQEHASSHHDWNAVVTGRAVREGLIAQIGRFSYFVSRREFDSADDYERTLAFFRSALGPRFKG